MAANQLLATLPMITLDTGCTVTIEAIDPASGAAVTGVVVSSVAFRTVGGIPSARPDEHDPAFAHDGSDT